MLYGNQKPLLGTPINYGKSISKGLVGAWLFNEGSGNKVYDASGNSNHGDIVTATWAAGKFGSCLNCNGSTEKVSSNAKNLPTGPTDAWTMSAIIAIDSYVSLSNIFGFGVALPNSGEPWDNSMGKNRYIIEFNNNYYFWGGTRDWDTGVPLDVDSKYHHIVFTNDGSYLRFYRDGMLVAGPQASPSFIVTVENYVNIGSGHRSASSSWDGKIDTCSIWNRALTAAEIQQLYIRPFSPWERDPIELWTPTGGEPPETPERIMTTMKGYW